MFCANSCLILILSIFPVGICTISANCFFISLPTLLRDSPAPTDLCCSHSWPLLFMLNEAIQLQDSSWRPFAISTPNLQVIWVRQKFCLFFFNSWNCFLLHQNTRTFLFFQSTQLQTLKFQQHSVSLHIYLDIYFSTLLVVFFSPTMSSFFSRLTLTYMHSYVWLTCDPWSMQPLWSELVCITYLHFLHMLSSLDLPSTI